MDTLGLPSTFVEVATGIVMLVTAIFAHGIGLRAINGRFKRAWSRVTPHTPHWRTNLMLGTVIGALATLHMAETLLFAAPLRQLGLFPNLRDSYYFTLECYTTLGEGSLRLPEPWRLLGPIIAMAGLFTFGWTGSVLVTIMAEFSQLDSHRAQKDLDDAGGAGTAREP